MVRKVRKRDGRIVRFDQSKIASAIVYAGRAAGQDHDFLAEELASVVALFIQKGYSGSVPSVENIQDIVERVLMETGHPDTARNFILHSERRKKQRETLRILDLDESPEEGRAPEVDHSSRGRISAWSKAAILSDLVNGARLTPSLASEIASDVEKRVFRSGLTRISSSLVRELVDNELFNRGFSSRIFSGVRVGIPASQIRKMIESNSPGWTPFDIASGVSDSVLQRFSLREIYTSEEVELHLRGIVCLEGLSLPSGYQGIVLYPRNLPMTFGSPQASASRLGVAVRFLEKFSVGPVEIDLTEAALERICVAGEGIEEFARRLIMALSPGPAGVPGVATRPVIRLGRSLTPSGERILENAGIPIEKSLEVLDGIVSAFLEALSDLGGEIALPVFHIDLAGRAMPAPELLSRLVVLETSGRVVLGMRELEVEAFAAVRPLISSAAVDVESILNSGRDDKRSASTESVDRFFDDLKSTLRVAASAFGSKNRFLAELHRNGRGPKAALRRFMGCGDTIVGSGDFRIVPVRLAEVSLAAQHYGTAARCPKDFYLKVQRFMHEVLAEEERRLGIRIRLGSPWDSSVGEYLSWLVDSPAASAEITGYSARWCGLDRLPGFYSGEAPLRMEYLQALMRERSEWDHAN